MLRQGCDGFSFGRIRNSYVITNTGRSADFRHVCHGPFVLHHVGAAFYGSDAPGDGHGEVIGIELRFG